MHGNSYMTGGPPIRVVSCINMSDTPGRLSPTLDVSVWNKITKIHWNSRGHRHSNTNTNSRLSFLSIWAIYIYMISAWISNSSVAYSRLSTLCPLKSSAHISRMKPPLWQGLHTWRSFSDVAISSSRQRPAVSTYLNAVETPRAVSVRLARDLDPHGAPRFIAPRREPHSWNGGDHSNQRNKSSNGEEFHRWKV